MGKAAKIWLDVSLRNLVIMLAAAAGMGVAASTLLSLIPRPAVKEIEQATSCAWDELLTRHARDLERFQRIKRLVGHLTLLEKSLLTAMVSLADYNRIQDAFVAALGHPWRLREAGQYAISKSFGLEAVEKLLLRAFLRWFTDPFVAISLVASGNKTFNHNKVAEANRAGLGRAYVFYRYNHGPAGIPARMALEDRRSLLYWIRGIFEKMTSVWPTCGDGWLVHVLRLLYPVQKLVGEVHYRVIGMDVRELIRAEAPGVERRLQDGCLFLKFSGGDWQPYGETVVLLPHDEGELAGRYLGACRSAGEKETGLTGVRLTRDIVVEGDDGLKLPIALKDEIFAPHAPHTVIEMRWVTHPLWSPLFRWLSEGPIKMQGLKVSMDAEMRTTEAAASAQTTTREMAALMYDVADAYPTQEIGRAIMQESFPLSGLRNTCAVVVCDVVGFTKAQLASEREGRTDAFVEALTDAMDACRADALLNGGWVKPTSGDQIIAFFPDSWGGYGKSAAQEQGHTLANVCWLAVETARAFRAHFEAHGFHVRVAVHVGDLQWQIIAGSFDASGSAISVAAHIEGVALKAELKARGREESLLAVTDDVLRQLQQMEPKPDLELVGDPKEVELKRGERIYVHFVA